MINTLKIWKSNNSIEKGAIAIKKYIESEEGNQEIVAYLEGNKSEKKIADELSSL